MKTVENMKTLRFILNTQKNRNMYSNFFFFFCPFITELSWATCFSNYCYSKNVDAISKIHLDSLEASLGQNGTLYVKVNVEQFML